VQVTERDIVRGRREHARRQLIIQGGLHVTLATAAAAAEQRRVRHDHVDRLGSEPGGEQRHDVRDAAGVVERVLSGLMQ
jgi:hypothetical protein